MPTIAHLAPSGQFPSYKTFRTFVRFDRLLQGSPPPPDAAAVSKSLSCCWCCEFRTLRSELSPGAGEKGTPRSRASAPRGCAMRACLSTARLPSSRLVASASLRAGQRQPPPSPEGAPLPGRIRYRAHATCSGELSRRAVAAHGSGTPRPRTSAAARLPLGCGRRIILVPSLYL